MTKILVDEIPEYPNDCPFSKPYTYVCTCKLSVGEAYKCLNTAYCPFLKVVEEKE